MTGPKFDANFLTPFRKLMFKPGELPDRRTFPALPTGWLELDHRAKPRRGDFWVVASIPNVGKSLFLKALTLRMAQRHGWVTGLISFEESLAEAQDQLVEMFVGKERPRFVTGEAAAALEFLTRHYILVSFDEQADDPVEIEPTMETIADTIADMASVVDCVAIDPWNEIDHFRLRDESLTEYVGRSIKTLKRLAKRLNILLIVLAHPTKLKPGEVPGLYDISDSANWANKSDVGIILTREQNSSELQIHVKKVRHQRLVGRPGEVRWSWDDATQRYDEIPREIWKK